MHGKVGFGKKYLALSIFQSDSHMVFAGFAYRQGQSKIGGGSGREFYIGAVERLDLAILPSDCLQSGNSAVCRSDLAGKLLADSGGSGESFQFQRRYLVIEPPVIDCRDFQFRKVVHVQKGVGGAPDRNFHLFAGVIFPTHIEPPVFFCLIQFKSIIWYKDFGSKPIGIFLGGTFPIRVPFGIAYSGKESIVVSGAEGIEYKVSAPAHIGVSGQRIVGTDKKFQRIFLPEFAIPGSYLALQIFVKAAECPVKTFRRCRHLKNGLFGSFLTIAVQKGKIGIFG